MEVARENSNVRSVTRNFGINIICKDMWYLSMMEKDSIVNFVARILEVKKAYKYIVGHTMIQTSINVRFVTGYLKVIEVSFITRNQSMKKIHRNVTVVIRFSSVFQKEQIT